MIREAKQKQYLLSVVATSRNDNHGESLITRMEHFVHGFIQQCSRHKIFAELIIVEWNPPAGNQTLAETLNFPEEHDGYCTIRIIKFPPELHNTLKHSDKLPLYQMIAKNVGIRRARGAYVLATNIDILFSDSLFRFLRKGLKKNFLYRADRVDVPHAIPTSPQFNEVLKFCKKNAFRINAKTGTLIKKDDKWVKLTPGRFEEVWKIIQILARDLFKVMIFIVFSFKELLLYLVIKTNKAIVFLSKAMKYFVNYIYTSLKKAALFFYTTLYRLTKYFYTSLQRTKLFFSEFAQSVIQNYKRDINKIHGHIKYVGYLMSIRVAATKKFILSKTKKRYSEQLHTNACGDFTLLSKENWHRLRGYPEWEIYSWHIDSVLLFQAKHSSIKEIDLPTKMCVYHIEHSVGSGFTPEIYNALFNRLENQKIPYLNNEDLDAVVQSMEQKKKRGKPVIFNNENWGFSHIELEEILI